MNEALEPKSDKEAALSELRHLAAESAKDPVKPLEDWVYAPSPEVLERSERAFAAGREQARIERQKYEQKILELQSNPERLQKEYKDAIKDFVNAELKAGATMEDIARRHAGESVANGPEKERLKMINTAFCRTYGYGDPQGIFFEKVLEDEFPNTEKVPEEGAERAIASKEQLRDLVLGQYLSYQDATLPEEAKKQALEYNQNSESAKRYAEALIEMSAKHNLAEVQDVAREMVEECTSRLEALGCMPSAYTASLSWAMWDIGKQEHYLLHPEQGDPKYTIADPLTSPEKREEIIDRHVGWEAFAAGRRGENSFLERVPEVTRTAATEYLSRTPKSNGTLSSKELAELGALLRI